ncbi:MAG: protein kinase, partial [Pseudomonadota bacterium]
MRKRRYRIAELLGQGGFGSVYRAEKLGEEGFSTVVAIKLLHAVADSSNPELERMRADAVRRLRDEARLLGLLKHRAIVQVYDLERLRGEWAVVMEFVDGMHLGELVELTRVPVRQALAITEEVADGLHVAFHTKLQGRELGLLHRDIKPSNIMITAGGSVKVLDFGIARGNFEARESHTAGFLVGTQRYMSPEHLDFDDESFQVGPASDIYALGAVIFEILTGQPLGRASLERRSHEDRVARQLDEHLLGRVPKGLFSLLRRTLAFGPDERPTAIELRTACELLQQETPGESLRSWSERVVGAMIRQRREHHQPPADALVGTVVEEGSPGPAAPASHPTIAPAEPPAPAPAPVRPAAPAAPVAPVLARAPRWRPPGADHSAGAIGIDDADEAQVAALGANLSTLDESAEPVAGGLGISFEGDEPDLARSTRRRQAAAGEGSPRLPLYIAAGVGLLVVIGGGLWGHLGPVASGGGVSLDGRDAPRGAGHGARGRDGSGATGAWGTHCGRGPGARDRPGARVHSGAETRGGARSCGQPSRRVEASQACARGGVRAEAGHRARSGARTHRPRRRPRRSHRVPRDRRCPGRARARAGRHPRRARP